MKIISTILMILSFYLFDIVKSKIIKQIDVKEVCKGPLCETSYTKNVSLCKFEVLSGKCGFGSDSFCTKTHGCPKYYECGHQYSLPHLNTSHNFFDNCTAINECRVCYCGDNYFGNKCGDFPPIMIFNIMINFINVFPPVL